MELYVAKFDYEKERDDILSFKEGDKFHIASKADKKWWAAYALDSGEYGYVPSMYLEQFVDPLQGQEAQELAESSVGERKRVTLQELKNKVPRTPASASNLSDEDDDSSRSSSAEPIIIKPLTSLSQPPEECVQIEPRPLFNPVMESKLHMKLHKELRLNNARGGVQNLGKPELEKVMQRRRADKDGKPGPIRAGERGSVKSVSPDNELASQLAKRTTLLEEAEKQDEVEQNKPEFMKVSLRKTPQLQQR